MATGLPIGVALAGALAWPLMLLLGRRGIGPGCVLGRCGAAPAEQSIRARQQELAARIAELETEQKQRLPSPR